MLDDRYHRTPDNAPENGSKTMLGQAQLAWLKRGLLQSQAPIKVLASGCEWESHGLKNSWTTFKRERDELFQFIVDHGLTGILLLSGDRHFTAAYQVIGRFIEVTSGPLGSRNAETRPTPEMFYYSGRGKYYCIYDIDTAGEKPAVTLEVYRTGDGLVERRAFTWEEVTGAAKIRTLASPAAKVDSRKAIEAKANP
jgi:alkaline phosphatase D